MRVAFAGTPEFALPALRALRAQHEVVGVLTQPDRPSGRGRRLTASAVKRAALELGLPLAQPETLVGDATRRLLGDWRAELLVVVAYGLRLPRAVLELPPLGCLNIHPSLLPRWRGAAPVERALLAGDVRTGITLMQMDAGLDTGPILLQRPIDISPHDTGGTLREKLAALGAAALLEALDRLAAGSLHAVAQPAAGATHAPKVEKVEARIDWSRDAVEIDRQVRAFNPSPVAATVLEGEPLRVFAGHMAAPELGDLSAANVGEKSSNRSHSEQIMPGTILSLRGDEMVVQCGRARFALTQVQRPGRRRLSVGDFAQGRALIGRRLG